MQIGEIFKKDLFRPINGVVKADQRDDAIVWQELEEYVLTVELDKHFRRFFDIYLGALDNPKDPVLNSRMGVWVSGFFGSGKSHFIKILSYLLSNHGACHPDTKAERRAIEFFSDKVKDHMFFADLKRSARTDTDVILFNIDSKANKSDGQAALLTVFWRVFNEMQGFCGESRQIAELERHLTSVGKLDQFRQNFEDLTGSDWLSERDAYLFRRDEIVEVLIKTLGWSQQAADQWFEKSEQEFDLSIETFAKRVNEYLDTKGPQHRLIFLVDEVGQFIGGDPHLMLNLQTLTEDLGRVCHGRVWVVVTSQEDIDSILGEVNPSKLNDFSKIQGRFHTRLSLSSSNTDEVIQARLLEKLEDAETELAGLFKDMGDILKNQLSFTRDSVTMKNFRDEKDFCANYPFAPYHFQLVQKIFESIRKAGATGLHLSRGERSMLDAFQSAAKAVSDKSIGALVPLYEFYPAIQGFLDTAVKRSIDQAAENSGLTHPFDEKLLQVLFLVRYIDLIKPNVDNLVTLCIEEVDTDRLALKRSIQDSLQRLERENLVSRSGDHYFFLTNEEREVTREIKNVELDSTAEPGLLREIIFEDVLKNKNKHRFDKYKRDYPFSRVCDGVPHGTKAEQDLTLEIITPLNDQYNLFSSGKCIMHTSEPPGALLKFPDNRELLGEIRTYVQTDKYIKLKSDVTASPTLKRILRDQQDDNRLRRERMVKMVDDHLLRSECYALGNTLEPKATNSRALVDEALDFLINNVYNKFSYLKHLSPNPQQEISSTLKVDDLGQEQIEMELGTVNAEALKELRTHIELKISASQAVTLNDVIEHFSIRPFGWSEWEVVLLVARLFMGGEITLSIEGGKLSPKDAIGPLTKSGQWKTVKIHKRKIAGEQDLKNARKLGQDLFGNLGGEKQDELASFLKTKLKDWQDRLSSWQPYTEMGAYPGKKEIKEGLNLVTGLLQIHEAYEFIMAFNRQREDLRDASDDFHDLKDFFTNQKPAWDSLMVSLDAYKPNATLLVKVPDAASAWNRMNRIAETPTPYGMIHEVAGLVAKVGAINDKIVTEKREAVIRDIDGLIATLKRELDAQGADGALKNKCLSPLQETRKQAQDDKNVPQLSFRIEEAKERYEDALITMDDVFKPPDDPKPPKQVKNVKPASLAVKAYLETEQDVEKYVAKVRDELLQAINNGMKVRIQ